MNIITLTLNPAFDVHCFIKGFAPYHENLATITENDAGGKGVNISRALTSCGVENLALVVLGEENGESFTRSLEADGIIYRSISVKGRIRENITVHTDNAPETRIFITLIIGAQKLCTKLNFQARNANTVPKINASTNPSIMRYSDTPILNQ